MQQQAGKAAPTLLHHHPLVLLLLLLPWSLTGPLACNAATDEKVVVLGEGEQHTFHDEQNDTPTEMTLFVKRNNSFAGFSVNVSGSDGTEHTAWFPAKEEYFPDTDIWYQLLVHAEIKTENSAIEFGFETATGKWTCERDNNSQDLHSLHSMNVEAHGAASWTTDFPPGGRYKSLAANPKRHKPSICSKPEPKTEPEPQHHTSTPEPEPGSQHHTSTPEPELHISKPEHNEPTAGMSAGGIAWLCAGLLVGALVVGGAALYMHKKGPCRKSYTAASQSA